MYLSENKSWDWMHFEKSAEISEILKYFEASCVDEIMSQVSCKLLI